MRAKEKVVIPRIELKAMELIEAKFSFNKYYLSEIAHCDQRTAQRALSKLHRNNKVVIKDWFKHYQHWIPIYGKSRKGAIDKPKPLPIPRSEIAKKYSLDVEHQIDRLMRDRARRTIKRIGI